MEDVFIYFAFIVLAFRHNIMYHIQFLVAWLT